MVIVISIPVHEKPDVINDQISNINQYIENPIIVLHLSQSFFCQYDESSIIRNSNVFINPQHLVTQWGNIYETHISNYAYIKDKIPFDYFLLQSSNDMFIKPGIEKYISSFDAGFNKRFIWDGNSMWWPANEAIKDLSLKKIMNHLGITRIVASQIEGSFYKKEIFDFIVKTIHGIITDNDRRNFNHYTREEIWFSTIASKIVDFNRTGYPTTFSEVHRFDRSIWTVRERFDRLYHALLLQYLFGEKLEKRIEGKINNFLFSKRYYKIKKKDIIDIRNDSRKFINKNEFLNDSPGWFRLSTGNYFSVKRVRRTYDDEIRTYIRMLSSM